MQQQRLYRYNIYSLIWVYNLINLQLHSVIIRERHIFVLIWCIILVRNIWPLTITLFMKKFMRVLYGFYISVWRIGWQICLPRPDTHSILFIFGQKLEFLMDPLSSGPCKGQVQDLGLPMFIFFQPHIVITPWL